MASRILTCVSCTLCFSLIVTLTIIGLTSILVGFIGLGLYIPTYINYHAYNRTSCFVADHDHEACPQQDGTSANSCFSVTWSVEYFASNSTYVRYVFSTITQTYGTSTEAMDELKVYTLHSNHTCHYQKAHITDVQWSKPNSPQPYLIMMIVGFILAGIYFIVLGIIAFYRCRDR